MSDQNSTAVPLPTQKGKHPKALYILFLTEMWERFAYYLMVGILFLYLIGDKGGKGMTVKTGADVLGSFIALVYLTPFIGGLLADRYLGYIRSIFIGGSLMALGYFCLALPGNTALYISLSLIIVGNGFFKPNISTILGNIYNREDLKPLKDNAYNIFYLGINIGALVCNFVAAYLRNKYGWGYAFAAAGAGLVIGLLILASNLKKVKIGDIKKEKKPEDMPLSKILGYVFLPAIIAAIIGWFLPKMVFGTSIMGSQSNDAFVFACLPIIAFYMSLYFRAKGEEKRGIGALLFLFGVSIIFWTIYNQNATGLTLWAQKHTDRTLSPITQKIVGSLGSIQEVSDTPHLVDKVNAYFVDQKDFSTVVAQLPGGYDSLSDGNLVDAKTHIIQVMGPDPYYNNIPKSQWPKSGTLKLANTELFQSINPFFIIVLTPLLVVLFTLMRRRKKEPTTPAKFGMALFISGLSALVMVFAVLSVNSVYMEKTSPYWLWGTYCVFTVSELLISPIGLSLVSKLAPPRLTALMMGGWFLATSLGGKIAGIMTSFWDVFTDKKIFFLILVVAAFLGGVWIFARIKSLNEIVKERTGSA
ncbi:MAG: peptide MFS transporter [Bacteroidota bacterium]|nr:peptide MFS transporter [Bacteroidota bacterium]